MQFTSSIFAPRTYAMGLLNQSRAGRPDGLNQKKVQGIAL